MGALKKKTGVAYAVNAVLVVILFVVLLVLIDSGTLNRYNTTIITNLCINVILAVSLNLVTGILGQLVLGHAGFMLAGAYAAALFTKNIGLPLSISLPIGLVLGGLLAAVFGVVIGIPALRLRGDYLAIITLGFGDHPGGVHQSENHQRRHGSRGDRLPSVPGQPGGHVHLCLHHRGAADFLKLHFRAFPPRTGRHLHPGG